MLLVVVVFIYTLPHPYKVVTKYDIRKIQGASLATDDLITNRYSDLFQIFF